MSTKKTLLSVVVAFLLSNILTTIWYAATDEANYVPYRREEINYLALVLNHLVYAGIMVFFFPYFYAKATRKIRGFAFGVMMATLMFLPQAMVIRAIWAVDFDAIFILNTLAHLIIGGIMGLSLSIIYDYKNTTDHDSIS